MKVGHPCIKSFVMQSGERYCLLVDGTSKLPLYYPNLFVTTQIRNNSLSVAAMETTLSAVNLLLAFCDEHEIDLETRFLQRKFLTIREIDGIRDHCQKRLAEARLTLQSGRVLRFPRKNHNRKQSVALSTEYVRLTYIAKYSKWLAETLLSDSADRDAARNIEAMQKQLISRRPKRKGRNQLNNVKGPDDQQLKTLFEVIRPGSEVNPFVGVDIQIRNRLVILILLYLGIRAGELLNIRISDIDWDNNRLVIARRHDEKDDPRVDQPLVKTLDHLSPMKDTLVAEMFRYVKKIRRNVPNARRNDYLLVTHKSGPTQGQPMSISAYQEVIRSIAGACSDFHELHGHGLRHAWNRLFSELMDSMDDPPTPEEQEKVRSYLQGWKPNSGTGAIYNRRFIERKAMEASLKLQQGSTRIPENLKNE